MTDDSGFSGSFNGPQWSCKNPGMPVLQRAVSRVSLTRRKRMAPRGVGLPVSGLGFAVHGLCRISKPEVWLGQGMKL